MVGETEAGRAPGGVAIGRPQALSGVGTLATLLRGLARLSARAGRPGIRVPPMSLEWLRRHAGEYHKHHREL